MTGHPTATAQTKVIPTEYVLSLSPAAKADWSENAVVVDGPGGSWRLRLTDSPGIREAMDRLAAEGQTEDELAALVEARDGVDVLATLYYYLAAFAARGLLCYSIRCEDGPLATLWPNSPFGEPPRLPDELTLTCVLSRFSFLHKVGNVMMLESPLTPAVITLPGWQGAAIIGYISTSQTRDSTSTTFASVPRESVSLLLRMLIGAGFASAVAHEELPGSESDALAGWEFHDLVFHARSRMGRHAHPYGATYRFAGKTEPPPAVKTSSGEDYVELYRPDMRLIEAEDPPFAQILESRRSVREHGDRPITDAELGEFLFRSARVKEVLKMEMQDLSRRPYPAGGAIYELELYVTIRRCESIAAGLYHYCPMNHRLESMRTQPAALEALLEDAIRSAGLFEAPQVLITVAARFQRLMWKYQSMAYNVLLKNVGALYQTMYLVATAMSLAPCALGGGDSDLFARAAGLNYYVETSVGEFILGSRGPLRTPQA